jgi:hypothetical protein
VGAGGGSITEIFHDLYSSPNVMKQEKFSLSAP